jgi:hypothetical protein
MAKDLAERVKERLKEGWLKAWVAVEVLAVTEEAADTSLQKHVEKLEGEEHIIVYMKDFKKAEKVDNPFRKGASAYSKVVEVELIARRFEHLMYLVMNYAPSSIEILEPSKVQIELGEAQTMLNTVAELIHKFALASRGAVTVDA